MRFTRLRIYLHRPRSQLTYGAAERTSKCAPPPSNQLTKKQERFFKFHTTKVLEAAEAGTGLLTLPLPFTTHSPLVICGLTLIMLAQISACPLKQDGPDYKAGRERVRLGLAAIKALGQRWEIGATTLKEIQTIARHMLSLQNPMEKATAATFL